MSTYDLLNRLLAGDPLTADQLDDLLATRVQEDLHLEYKHANLLASQDHPHSGWLDLAL